MENNYNLKKGCLYLIKKVGKTTENFVGFFSKETDEQIEIFINTDIFGEYIFIKKDNPLFILDLNKINNYDDFANDGNFDCLPPTCEFTEPITLELSNDNDFYLSEIHECLGKFQGKYLVQNHSNIECFNYARIIKKN